MSNGISILPGEGTVLAEVLHDNAGVPICGGDETPTSVDGALYDGADTTHWTRAGTAAKGASWVPGVVTGAVSLKVSPPLPTPPVTIGGTIYDGDITFLTVPIQ